LRLVVQHDIPTHQKVKVKVKLSRYHHVGAKRERNYNSYSLLTSAPAKVSDQRYAPATIYPWEKTSDTHWIGDWRGLRAGLT